MNTVSMAKCYVNKSKNAASRGLEFNMSLISFINILSQTHCAYTGIEFDCNNPLSLERIDNSKGYIDGNVIPVVKHINSIRSSMTSSDIHNLIDKMNSEIESPGEIIKDVKKFLNDYDSLVSGVENSLIEFRKSLNSIQNVKPRIPASSYDEWFSKYHYITSLSKKIELLDKTHTRSKAEKTKNNNRRTCLKNSVKSYRKFINSFEKTDIPCEPIISHHEKMEIERLEQKLVDLKARKESDLAALKNYERKKNEKRKSIVTLEKIKKSLHFYENMSESDLEKVKLGLPVDTSYLKTLKHKFCAANLHNKL